MANISCLKAELRNNHVWLMSTLDQINAFLGELEIPLQLEALEECVPLLWVAIAETLLKREIPGIIRTVDPGLSLPERISQKKTNLETLFRFFKDNLNISFSRVNVVDIIRTNESTIQTLITFFMELKRIIEKSEQEGYKETLFSDISSIHEEEPEFSLGTSALFSPPGRFQETESEGEIEETKEETSQIRLTRSTNTTSSSYLEEAKDDVSDFLERKSKWFPSRPANKEKRREPSPAKSPEKRVHFKIPPKKTKPAPKRKHEEHDPAYELQKKLDQYENEIRKRRKKVLKDLSVSLPSSNIY